MGMRIPGAGIVKAAVAVIEKKAGGGAVSALGKAMGPVRSTALVPSTGPQPSAVMTYTAPQTAIANLGPRLPENFIVHNGGFIGKQAPASLAGRIADLKIYSAADFNTSTGKAKLETQVQAFVDQHNKTQNDNS